MKYIGVVDSGIGGYNIYYPLKKRIKNAKFIYYKDKFNLPYGNKENAEMELISKEIATNFLKLDNKIDILIIACNTLSNYKEVFNKVFENKVIVIDIISINIEYIIKRKIQNVLVLGTVLTINKKVYEEKLKEENIKTINIGLKDWAVLIENKKIKEIDRDLININSKLNKNKKIIYILPACTHYLNLKKTIKNRIKCSKIIDSTNYLCEKIRKII